MKTKLNLTFYYLWIRKMFKRKTWGLWSIVSTCYDGIIPYVIRFDLSKYISKRIPKLKQNVRTFDIPDTLRIGEYNKEGLELEVVKKYLSTLLSYISDKNILDYLKNQVFMYQ